MAPLTLVYIMGVHPPPPQPLAGVIPARPHARRHHVEDLPKSIPHKDSGSLVMGLCGGRLQVRVWGCTAQGGSHRCRTLGLLEQTAVIAEAQNTPPSSPYSRCPSPPTIRIVLGHSPPQTSHPNTPPHPHPQGWLPPHPAQADHLVLGLGEQRRRRGGLPRLAGLAVVRPAGPHGLPLLRGAPPAVLEGHAQRLHHAPAGHRRGAGQGAAPERCGRGGRDRRQDRQPGVQ